jgi:hypothetical protein
VAVTAAGRESRFEKANGEWTVKAPVEGRADFSAVDGLVSRLAGLQMKSLVADPGEPKQYGLDKPAATVRIGSGSSQATLVAGGPAAEGSIYAKDVARPAVFTVESSLLEDLKKDASEYQQKDLFDARSFSATRMEIVRAGQTTVFEKTKTKDKDGKDVEKWKQTAPSARDVDPEKMEALITAVTNARATSFAPPTARTGLEKPELTVAFKFDGNKEERVAFARSGATVYAARAGSAGAAIVDAAVLDAAVKALEALK